MLLAAQDEEDGHDHQGRGMTDEQVRDEAMTIFLAGHETTANALTWTWYLLSQAPEVEARLHEEVDRVLGGRLPTVADIPSLPFVEQVVTESMRLYPPAWIVGRRTIEPYAIDDYVAPSRSLVVFSPYIVQRDARYFRRARSVSAGSVDARVQSVVAAVCLPAVRRRTAALHRRVVCVDGADAGPEHPRAALAAAARPRASGCSAGIRHPPHQARDADDRARSLRASGFELRA